MKKYVEKKQKNLFLFQNLLGLVKMGNVGIRDRMVSSILLKKTSISGKFYLELTSKLATIN